METGRCFANDLVIWEKQFGDVRIPIFYGDPNNPDADEKVLYRGVLVGRDDLGNIAYGYLGSAMNIHEEVLLMAGGVVEIVSTQINGTVQFSDQVNAFFNDGLYGEPYRDYVMVKFGVDSYYQDAQK